MTFVDGPAAVDNPLGEDARPPRAQLDIAGEHMPKLKMLAKAAGVAGLPAPVVGLKAVVTAALGVLVSWFITDGLYALNGHAKNIVLAVLVVVFGPGSLLQHAQMYTVWSSKGSLDNVDGDAPMIKLQRLRVSPAAADELKAHADGHAISHIAQTPVWVAGSCAAWFFDISAASDWLLGAWCVWLIFLESTVAVLGVATCRASAIVVRNQLQQCTSTLTAIIERSKSEVGDLEQPTEATAVAAREVKAMMQQLDYVHHETIPLCQQCANPTIICAGVCQLSLGVMFTYLGATSQMSDSVVFNGIIQVFALTNYYGCFQLLAAPMSVSAASMELLTVVNRIRMLASVELSREANVMIDFLKDQNNLHGPGYTIGGQLITPGGVWSVCGALSTVVVGAFFSSI